MSLTLSSIIKQEIINAGSVFQCHLPQGNYILMKTSHPMTAYYENSKVKILTDSIMCGNRFVLENRSQSIAQITGVKFKTTSDQNILSLPLYVSPSVPLSVHELFQLIVTCKCPNLLVHQINQIVKQLESHLNKLNQVQIRNGNQMLIGEIDPRLIKVHRYVRENYSLPLTLRQLADMISCNPVYLSNMYSKVFSKSPVQHIQSLRMKHAQKLLANTKKSISEIAHQLGYVSSSQFASIFKKHFNVSPTKFRVTQHLNDL